MEGTMAQRLARIDAGVSGKSERVVQREYADARVARQKVSHITGPPSDPMRAQAIRADIEAKIVTLEAAERERTEAARRDAGAVPAGKLSTKVVADASPALAKVDALAKCRAKTVAREDGAVWLPSAVVPALPALSGSAVKIAVALAARPGDVVSIDTLCEMIGAGKRTVERAKAELSEKGLLPGG